VLPIQTLLPLYSLQITLQFTETSTPKLFHQPALTAWLRHFLPADDESYADLIYLEAPESGNLHYQAGDNYCFSLTALAGGAAMLQHLLTCLMALPNGVAITDKNAPFRNNLRFIAAQDLFTQTPVAQVSDLAAFTEADLQAEVAAWQAIPEVNLRWLAPTRLLLPKADREHPHKQDEMRYCRHGTHLSFALLNNRLHDTFAHLLRHRVTHLPVRQADNSSRLMAAEGFWVDFSYVDKHRSAKTMGGLLGTVQLDMRGLSAAQWTQWVLGQYVGVGQRRAFGWGRYHLETLDGQTMIIHPHSATSLLSLGDSTQLYEAYTHIAQQSADAQADPAEQDGIVAHLSTLYAQLLEGTYAIPALQATPLRDETGRTRRLLAVPPFYDRVLQRAVAQLLTPALDSIMYCGSFGFRAGHSRHQAASMIQRAYAQGYEWVLESDVNDFFDTIQWPRLATRLFALFGDEPLISWVLAWMQAPLEQHGEVQVRSAGLPQGSPLSPVLANLMLDDFDSDLVDAGFRLVRFADDFVVLCRSREAAEQAEQLVRTALAEVGLRVNEEKTQVRSFAEGFRFLGFLFMNSLVLDVGNEQRPQVVSPTAISNKSTPPNPARAVAVNQVGELDKRGTLVFVTGPPAVVSTAQQRLQVTRVVDDTQTTMPTAEFSVAWRQVQAVVLIGGQHHITTPALREALRFAVPIHFADAGGQYQGSTVSGAAGTADSSLWLAQLAWLGQADNGLTAANGLIKARLLHQREVLRKRNLKRRFDKSLEELKRLANRASVCSDLAKLRGFEGAGAACYFKALQQIIPEQFGFAGRSRRPPPDPFNALLSLGYTVLFTHMDTVVRTNGLLPWVGVYHQPKGNHPVLVSDLMEPFRHVVEREALTLLDRKQFTLEDFVLTEQAGCRLTDAARQRYLLALSERFEQPMRGQQWSEGAKLHAHMQYQVASLVDWIRGVEAQLFIWRMH